SRPLLRVLGISLILLGFLALGPALAGARTKAPGTPVVMDWILGAAFFWTLGVVPVGLGVLLVLIADRSLPARMAARIRSLPPRVPPRLSPASLARAVAHP